MTVPDPSTFASPRFRVLLTAALLAVAVFAAYSNTLSSPFVWDDGGSITENPTIRRLWPLSDVLSPPGAGVTVSGRPVMNLSLALNYAISGEAVWSYHLFNLAFHVLAGVTLFGLVRRTLETPPLRPRFGGAALPLAAAVAGLWLLHPLQTESVTYISQRAESLGGLFFLLTFYAFVRASSSSQPWRWRVLAVGACLAGVGTKEILAAVPPLIFLYDRTFVAGSFRDAWQRRRWLHLSLCATWVPLALLVASTGWNRGGTFSLGAGGSLYAYWLTQFEAVVTYLKLALWPQPLIFDRGLFWVVPAAAAPFAAVVLLLLAGTVVALARWPVIGFLGAWFFVILAPTSLVPGMIQIVVEHRMYLPLAAIVALAVAGLHALAGRRVFWLWPALAVALGGVTFARNHVYRSAAALWNDTVVKVPGNARARYNLGIAYSEQGRYAEAVEQGELALRLDRTGAYANKAHLVHNKLGRDLESLGRLSEATDHYRQALALSPGYSLAHLNLARALVRLDRPGEAIAHYEQALRHVPDDAPIAAELGDALLRAGRVDDAIARYRAVLQVAPTASGFNNLAYALLLARHVEESVAAYRESVRLDPGDAAAWVGLGYALIAADRPAEAIAPCTEAVKLQPDFADAHNTLGIALAQTGRTAEAIGHFERALQLNPTAADVHGNLGNALAAAGRHDEAIVHYREALRLNPDYVPARRALEAELRRARPASERSSHQGKSD